MAKLLLFIGICFFLAGEAPMGSYQQVFVLLFLSPLAVNARAVESFEVAK